MVLLWNRTRRIFLSRLRCAGPIHVHETLDPAHVETPDLDKAYAVAEFMLNLLDIKSAPTREDVKGYIRANFATEDGRYRIPVHQDFLQIRHRPQVAAA